MSNEPKHTETPWHVEAYEVYDNQDLIIADCGLMDDLKMVEANAARIVQCVNACEGMDDPEYVLRIMKGIKANKNGSPCLDDVISELESLRAENAELIEALRVGRNELERAKMSLIQSDYSEQSSTIQSINNALTTLAKYEKP